MAGRDWRASLGELGQDGMTGGEIDHCVDVTFKRRTADAVWFEQRSGLRGVVSLLEKEIRDGRMRQVRDSWRQGKHQRPMNEWRRDRNARSAATDRVSDFVEQRFS